jgi:hypothetical protein
MTLAVMILGATLSYAQGQGRGGMGGEPLKEVLSACENKSSDDSCSMSTSRGDTLSGTCKNTPENKYFVCMPSNGATVE